MHLSIPYHFIQTFIYHNTITILLQCGQHIRHLSAEYAGHIPILHYSVTYLQINQLAGFPADWAHSIRIGRPSHILARMYQLP